MINAYLDFIRDVAQELNNGQDIDPDDVKQMFRLEKKIAQVSFLSLSTGDELVSRCSSIGH